VLNIGNSTLSGNTAPNGYGGAIVNGPAPNDVFGAAMLGIGSTIVTGNMASMGPEIVGAITTTSSAT
jgi:hypothetical protein